jgi:adenosylhomocysteinase
VIAADHIAHIKHQAIVGNIGHFDNEIDMAGLARVPGIEQINTNQVVHVHGSGVGVTGTDVICLP